MLLILGIVSAVAVPALNNTMDEMKLNGAVREVVSAIQYSRSLSIKESDSYGVWFNKTLQQISCFKVTGNKIILHPVDKKLYILDFTGAGQLQGLNLVSTTLVGNKAIFNDLGEPSESGSVILRYAGLQKTINIAAPLGKVSVN